MKTKGRQGAAMEMGTVPLVPRFHDFVQKHCAPWVKSRQYELEASVKKFWK